MSIYDEIWKRHIRKKCDTVTLSFDRFTVDKTPVCMAWYGLGGYERMACSFLGTSHFGSRYHCLYCNEEIFPDENSMLNPVGECPLWK